MAKQKKAKADATGDQHTSNLLVRYPEELRAVFDAIKEKLGQPYTVAARRALLEYAAKHGVEVKGVDLK